MVILVLESPGSRTNETSNGFVLRASRRKAKSSLVNSRFSFPEIKSQTNMGFFGFVPKEPQRPEKTEMFQNHCLLGPFVFCFCVGFWAAPRKNDFQPTFRLQEVGWDASYERWSRGGFLGVWPLDVNL